MTGYISKWADVEMIQFKELPKSFFHRPTLRVARDLLGRLLVHQTPSGTMIGRIVETEGYDETDAASHSCHGETERNAMMFEDGGSAYIYRSYGIHWCINVAVGTRGFGAAVLIRALEPLYGADLMAQNRAATSPSCKTRDLCRGPGRLCQAFAITGEQNGSNMRKKPLFIANPSGFRRPESLATPRIGISQAVDAPWRFCIPENRYVSGPAWLNRG